MKTHLIAMLLALGFIGWVGPVLADMKSDVTAAYGAWDAAFNRGDAKAVAAFYAADAKFLPADHSVHTGPADVEKFSPGCSRTASKATSLSPPRRRDGGPALRGDQMVGQGRRQGRRRGRDPHL